METRPYLGKESFLTSELHLRSIVVVVDTELFQRIFDVMGALAASQHVIVQYVECLRCIRKGLDTRREESARTISTEAVAARQSRKARRETFALSETICLCKNARLHLTEEVIREGGGIWLIIQRD